MGEFAPIYEAMAAHGIAADAVDRLELWQIAAQLGVGKADLQSEDIMAARMQAHREGKPPPTIDDIR